MESFEEIRTYLKNTGKAFDEDSDPVPIEGVFPSEISIVRVEDPNTNFCHLRKKLC